MKNGLLFFVMTFCYCFIQRRSIGDTSQYREVISGAYNFSVVWISLQIDS